MGNKTPLYQQHVEMHAKIVDFGGWEMPINYGSQIQEHHQVRTDAGMFDVSHMTVVDLQGDKVRNFLHYLLANNVDRLKTTGKALYTCMLNEQAGIIDDLIVYFMREDWFRLVVNAATHDKDLAWITKQAADFDVSVFERPELAMIAVQGPKAIAKAVRMARTKTHHGIVVRYAKLCSHLFMTNHATGQAMMTESIIHLTNSLESSRNTFPTEAPIVLRIPISFVLLAAMKDERPNNPRHAIRIATMAKLLMILESRSSFLY